MKTKVNFALFSFIVLCCGLAVIYDAPARSLTDAWLPYVNIAVGAVGMIVSVRSFDRKEPES
jgi:hypothetical protein